MAYNTIPAAAAAGEKQLLQKNDAATGEFLVDGVVRFERYADDARALCAVVGCNITKFEHKNPSLFNNRVPAVLSRPYPEVYTLGARSAVDRAFAVDAFFLGYTFTQPNVTKVFELHPMLDPARYA